jgi:hypothetical protein
VNHDWMREQLKEFVDLVGRYEATRHPGRQLGDPALRQQLYALEPTVKQVLRTLDSSLADRVNLDQLAGEAMARNEAHRGLGILARKDEWAANLAPDAPQLSADRLHRWVWDAARTFWETGHYRAAVDAAARAVNAHTQTKVGRRDVSDTDLMNQSLAPEKPKSGQTYLRIPGDPNDRTVGNRNRALRPFAEGCYAGIRAVAAHEHTEDWGEQRALESLSAFSIMAGWIEECDTFSAS